MMKKILRVALVTFFMGALSTSVYAYSTNAGLHDTVPESAMIFMAENLA